MIYGWEAAAFMRKLNGLTESFPLVVSINGEHYEVEGFDVDAEDGKIYIYVEE